MKPFKPPGAVATNSLIGLCLAVQGAIMLGGPGFGNAVIGQFGFIPARITAAIAGQMAAVPAFTTGLTHMLLHGGLIHLALNMVFLGWVGRYVEWVTGRLGLIFLFVTGGLIGAAFQYSAGPASTIPVIGASGAIASVFGAYAVLFARSRASTRTILGVTISGEVLTALWYAATWVGLQLLTGFVFSGPGGLGIAIWTHIGGFLTGLILARLWNNDPGNKELDLED